MKDRTSGTDFRSVVKFRCIMTGPAAHLSLVWALLEYLSVAYFVGLYVEGSSIGPDHQTGRSGHWASEECGSKECGSNDQRRQCQFHYRYTGRALASIPNEVSTKLSTQLIVIITSKSELCLVSVLMRNYKFVPAHDLLGVGGLVSGISCPQN